ncbi:DUF2533 family protein [Bacillus sp. HMF5848]|uniref:DUF2533 family protein n=1 Tax=Bacillus sp. HMF5848 TaxID=2495421 RepID=UPI000F78CF30|nr:DUF2533 family protein [Bacillus sp. HMF5848]RSK27328.1 DUF2533 family protein [Bacillus sp. HMF5848]
MAEVHRDISKHSKKQHEIVTEFAALDQERERHINVAIKQCQQGLPFSVEPINTTTEKINALARKTGIVPSRKLVTIYMVEEYVKQLNKE